MKFSLSFCVLGLLHQLAKSAHGHIKGPKEITSAAISSSFTLWVRTVTALQLRYNKSPAVVTQKSQVHYMLIELHKQHINIPPGSVLFMALPRASLDDPHADDFITKILQPERLKHEVHHFFLPSYLSHLVTTLNKRTRLLERDLYQVNEKNECRESWSTFQHHYKLILCWERKTTGTREAAAVMPAACWRRGKWDGMNFVLLRISNVWAGSSLHRVRRASGTPLAPPFVFAGIPGRHQVVLDTAWPQV